MARCSRKDWPLTQNTLNTLLTRVWLYSKIELLSQRRLVFNTEHIYHFLDSCMVVFSWTISQDGAVEPQIRLAFNIEHTNHSLGPCMVVLSWTIFQDGAFGPQRRLTFNAEHTYHSIGLCMVVQLDNIPRWSCCPREGWP